jgi:hypothetical protein
MPKSSTQKLKTQAERNARPEEVAKRVAYNRNRREAIAEGRVKVGDGKELDHKKPLDKGGADTRSNLRAVDASTNRAWRRSHPEMYTKAKK